MRDNYLDQLQLMEIQQIVTTTISGPNNLFMIPFIMGHEAILYYCSSINAGKHDNLQASNLKFVSLLV